jgi:hypothetical protein
MTSPQSTDGEAEEGVVYRTVFSVRYDSAESEHYLEVFYQYEDVGDKTYADLEKTRALIERMTGQREPPLPAMYIAEQLRTYSTRRRFNPDIKGPYAVITEGFKPSGDDMLAYWKANHKTMKPVF